MHTAAGKTAQKREVKIKPAKRCPAVKKIFFGAAALLLLAIISRTAFDTFAVILEETEVELAGLPAELDGFRILQISDIHGRRFAGDGTVARRISEAKPDIIVLTGDYVRSDWTEVYNFYPLLETLTKMAPVYAVSGNHDHRTAWPEIAGVLEKAGVEVLENRHVLLQKNGRTLVLAGVGDPHTGHDDLQAALPQAADGPVVLLAHTPAWFQPLYKKRFGTLPAFAAQQTLLQKVALTLCGHTHGGQVKLPFLGAVTTASGELLPKPHVEGLSREENGWLYISRGVGQSGILPFRFLSRAEISLIVLRSPEKK